MVSCVSVRYHMFQYGIMCFSMVSCVSVWYHVFQYGIAAHEIGHALGLFHEHQRPDRERYVSIIKQNVRTESIYVNNFAMVEEEEVNTYNLPYDYASVMAYAADVSTSVYASVMAYAADVIVHYVL